MRGGWVRGGNGFWGWGEQQRVCKDWIGIERNDYVTFLAARQIHLMLKDQCIMRVRMNPRCD